MYTFHYEAVVKGPDGGSEAERKELEAMCDAVRAAGMKVGIALKPSTPAEVVLPVLAKLDMVLVLTVEPGFGGQKFKEEAVEKCRTIRAASKDIHIEVDGGVSPATIGACAKVGANVIVAGTAIFKSPDPAETIKQLRDEVNAVAVEA